MPDEIHQASIAMSAVLIAMLSNRRPTTRTRRRRFSRGESVLSLCAKSATRARAIDASSRDEARDSDAR